MADPFELVRCDAYRMQLMPSRCAENWRSVAGKPRHTLERLQHCLDCPLGAQRAGKAAVPTPLPRFCCRCLTLSPRLIGKRLCPSCYNRGLEIQKGKNARGTPPLKALPVRPVALLVDGQRTEVQAVDALEACLFALRLDVQATVARAPVRVG